MKYIFLLLSLWPLSSYGQQSYEGHIGIHPIIAQLSLDDGPPFGVYAYKKIMKDIRLHGNQSGNSIELQTFESYNQEEHFYLRRVGSTLEGTWEMGNKKLRVLLKPSEKDYDTFQEEALSYSRKNIRPHGEYEMVNILETMTKVEMPRFGNGFSQEFRERANPILDSLHNYAAHNALECEYAEVDLKLHHIEKNIVSLVMHYSHYCGGAHPNYGQTAYNFDLISGKELKWNDVYPSISMSEIAVKEEQHFTHEVADENCEYDMNDDFKYGTWFIDKSGLVLVPNLPHVATVCAIEFTLPWDKALKYMVK